MMSYDIEQRVLADIDSLVDIGVLPIVREFAARDWLSNFDDGTDRELAAYMLESYLYLNRSLVDQLFISAVHNISCRFACNRTFAEAKHEWSSFLASCVGCHVTGETPSPADSGFAFARRLRDLIGFDEEQILDPERCVRKLDSDPSTPVVFVDDFVGSGNQFLTLLRRIYRLPNGKQTSLMQFAEREDSLFFYCPVICTGKGRHNIQLHAPRVVLSPAHFLPDELSPLHPQTDVFPIDKREQGHEMIRRLSNRLGFPDTDGREVDDWQGYQKLSCAISFEHGTPDATLPLFYHSSSDWKPLVKRST